ncbi:hypothetical protein IWT140_01686 [Secundilactobacillus pentosiphilus]|uniref:Uncharacterized protein n=1 Tax=Secundilactobacillus pentosiphilus TaxID=1714682 RepID=A0A1Z5IQN6_9LACO|nr:hypothetical protein [Secundilactobacillus pentosiphilus]GAX04049.1 hypothetical protein IWT140_01686 [Secundilactobacillus pentosiphilus]
MKKQVVTVDGVKYVVTEPANDEISESEVAGVNGTVKTVSGKGYRLNSNPDDLFEIEWVLDNYSDGKDADEWVKDWDTADAVYELD